VYAPTPAEDVFALGVTAYKLVTGEYPPKAEPLDAQCHVWKTEGPGPRPAHVLNARCRAELSTLISRMLSLQPEARGSARELAEALEQSAREAGPEADVPLFPGGTPWPSAPEKAPPRRDTPRVPLQSGASWLVAAGVAGCMVLGATWLSGIPCQEEALSRHEDARDAGIVGVGDSVLTAPVASTHAPSAGTPIALDLPGKPLRGQVRPDANGRCPFRVHVVINGGCWWKAGEDAKECEENAYVYQGRCYEPVFPRPRPATSEPAEARDGG